MTCLPAVHRLQEASNTSLFIPFTACRGLRATMFSAATPAAIKEREAQGRDGDLKEVLKVRGGCYETVGRVVGKR